MVKTMPGHNSAPCRSAGLVPVLLALAAGGCTSAGQVFDESKNYNSRISMVVIHHTTSDYQEALRILTVPSERPVSAHYLIPEPGDPSYPGRKLRVHQLVPEAGRAWHAGSSYWSEKTGLNDQSIGIELVNQAYCRRSSGPWPLATHTEDRICFYPDFADGQIRLLTDLLGQILQRYPDIRATDIVGHADIAPDRKIDPGPRFPWQRLYRLGYGAWYDDATVVKYWKRFSEQPLPLENIQQALHAYGYGIAVSGENDQHTRNVIRAFQMHFRPQEVSGMASAETAAVLFALIDKYHPEQLEQLLQVAVTSEP